MHNFGLAVLRQTKGRFDCVLVAFGRLQTENRTFYSRVVKESRD